MPDFHYAQFCPLARVAELVGERWTLLILRDLFVGAQRFSDLRRRLPGISASVLSQRLRALEANGLVQRATLPPPGRAEVIELTALGRDFEPAMRELLRFGLRFLAPPKASDTMSWSLRPNPRPKGVAPAEGWALGADAMPSWSTVKMSMRLVAFSETAR